jgi:hypothetical protein
MKIMIKIDENETTKKGPPECYSNGPFAVPGCAQIVPVKIKKFQTVPNETKNNISITY